MISLVSCYVIGIVVLFIEVGLISYSLIRISVLGGQFDSKVISRTEPIDGLF